jgi:pyruvate/2-oxoglutarate dehydrogenase complex dihydrolipoamide dehydrogenase (E3) component
VLYDVHTEIESSEPADAVILSTAREPVDGLARALEGRVPQLYAIGDALSARMLAAAVYEGQKFARLIGEPGAPADVTEAWFAPDDPATTLLPADVVRPAGLR